jgi:hypothetical protein
MREGRGWGSRSSVNERYSSSTLSVVASSSRRLLSESNRCGGPSKSCRANDGAGDDWRVASAAWDANRAGETANELARPKFFTKPMTVRPRCPRALPPTCARGRRRPAAGEALSMEWFGRHPGWTRRSVRTCSWHYTRRIHAPTAASATVSDADLWPKRQTRMPKEARAT